MLRECQNWGGDFNFDYHKAMSLGIKWTLSMIETFCQASNWFENQDTLKLPLEDCKIVFRFTERQNFRKSYYICDWHVMLILIFNANAQSLGCIHLGHLRCKWKWHIYRNFSLQLGMWVHMNSQRNEYNAECLFFQCLWNRIYISIYWESNEYFVIVSRERLIKWKIRYGPLNYEAINSVWENKPNISCKH